MYYQIQQDLKIKKASVLDVHVHKMRFSLLESRQYVEHYKNTVLLDTLKNKVTKMNNGTCILTAVGLVCSVFAVVFFVTPPAF